MQIQFHYQMQSSYFQVCLDYIFNCLQTNMKNLKKLFKFFDFNIIVIHKQLGKSNNFYFYINIFKMLI